jgi:hypothetical protein
LTIKKACFLKGKQAFSRKGNFRAKPCFFGSPAILYATKGSAGFVPLGYPRFTFSETSERSIVKELSSDKNTL